MSKALLNKVEYARVEVRVDGKTWVVELDPEAAEQINATIDIEHESRELTPEETNFAAWRMHEPTGRSRAAIRLTGWVKSLERSHVEQVEP